MGPTVPCPKGGRVVCDAGGRPQGLLYDAAQDLVIKAVPPLTQEVRVFSEHHFSFKVTMTRRLDLIVVFVT